MSIGENALIHPKCEILAWGGPIDIGANTIIEERVRIISDPGANGGNGMVISIGSNNLIEVGAVVQAAVVGDCNVIECKAVLPFGSTVGNGCVVGPAVTLANGQNVPDGTVVYGSERATRKDDSLAEKHKQEQQIRLGVLRPILEKAHKRIT